MADFQSDYFGPQIDERLRLAGTAYQKPDGGIPAEDIAPGVVPGTMVGAGESTDGASGTVPAPVAGDNNKFLRGDGTWQEIGGSDGAVRYDEEQALTEEEKLRARINIMASGGQLGVISQTQTWGDTLPYTYTMSDKVEGPIPQMFIDLVSDAGVVFNSTTGYFEINGLTDVSYEEMRAIYRHGDIRIVTHNVGALGDLNPYAPIASAKLRTLLCSATGYYGAQWALGVNFGVTDYTYVEVIHSDYYAPVSARQLSWAGSPYETINSTYLSRIDNISFGNVSGAKTFKCPNLRVCTIYSLKANLTLSQSSLLEAASVAIMINNVGTTSSITITLHATAYARANADADVQAALSAHTNVSLASA